MHSIALLFRAGEWLYKILVQITHHKSPYHSGAAHPNKHFGFVLKKLDGQKTSQRNR